MITGGQAQAYDEIFTLIRDGLAALPVTVIYQDDLKNVDVTTPVVIVNLQHVSGQQASMAGDEGRRKWRNDGIVYMSVRIPASRGLTEMNVSVNTCITAIRGKTTPGGIWFRNVVGKEEAPKDGNARSIVTGEFVYHELTPVPVVDPAGTVWQTEEW